MKIDILTLFPKMFKPILNESIIKRAQEKGLVSIKVHNLRDWAKDKYKTVDDTPYGGGAGMILKVDVIDQALANLRSKCSNCSKCSKRNSNKRSDSTIPTYRTILLTPKGKKFNQKMAKTLTQYSNLLLICGHYGGFDERIRQLVDMEISIGDFVLTGGEIPAMTIIDTVTRLIPGVINPDSLKNESHTKKGYKQYPQYTRPEKYRLKGIKIKKPLSVIPKILLSGNHAKIQSWRGKISKNVKH